MTQRLNYAQHAPDLFKALMGLSNAIKEASIEQSILDLVDIRASQINQCAFCLDMHSKEATIHGERPLRLYHLAAQRRSPPFPNTGSPKSCSSEFGGSSPKKTWPISPSRSWPSMPGTALALPPKRSQGRLIRLMVWTKPASNNEEGTFVRQVGRPPDKTNHCISCQSIKYP